MCNHDEGGVNKWKTMNGIKENSLELKQRNFEMRPVSDKFWATVRRDTFN
jgi:hypothetical protein